MSLIFVHVSDIHFGQEKDDRLHIHNDVKQQLVLDAKDVISKIEGGVPHGILVTGDIAQSGQRAEYEVAAKWLDELAANIGVEINCVQMVPGNHDLDWTKLSFSGEKVLEHIRTGGVERFEEILKKPADRAALFERFEDYDRFSFGYNCPLNTEGWYASSMQVNIAPGRAIRFIRLNSSLLCHGKERDEHPELILGARQFTIPRTNGVENVVLIHHPLNWFKDQDEVRNYIRSRARVFISGHEHNPKVTLDNVEQGCDVMMLSAGATVSYRSNDEFTFTYNIIEFDWDREIDGLSVTVHPRAWNWRRTQFEGDEKPLGGKGANFRLACPSFRKVATPCITGTTEPVELAAGLADACESEANIDAASEELFDEGLNYMPSHVEGYGITCLRFFRDLLEGERLRILIELDALPEGFNERMTQGLERKLLDKLARNGKVGDVGDLINKMIGERKEEASDE